MNDVPKGPISEIDEYAPGQIARRIENVGVAKAGLPALQTVTLGVLAGAFIALGAAFFTLVMTGSPAGIGLGRLIGGIAFSLGLILVVVAGAELFTGNNLIVMAWAERRISTASLLRNWALVYVANFVGAVGTALFVHLSGTLDLGGGAVRETALAIARDKTALPFDEAFFRGVLCNVLVCLAVWISAGARRVSGKILAIVFPIAAFVALGFEHSVANMYFIPLAMLEAWGDPALTVGGLVANLVPVTLGNIVGGGALVALVYWIIYLWD